MERTVSAYDKWNISVVTMMTSSNTIGTLGPVASLLAATLCQGYPDRKHKVWNIRTTESYTPYVGAVGMVLHVNRKFTIGKLKSSLLSYNFVLNRSSVNFEV